MMYYLICLLPCRYFTRVFFNCGCSLLIILFSVLKSPGFILYFPFWEVGVFVQGVHWWDCRFRIGVLMNGFIFI
jgi:hypothetical protein